MPQESGARSQGPGERRQADPHPGPLPKGEGGWAGGTPTLRQVTQAVEFAVLVSLELFPRTRQYEPGTPGLALNFFGNIDSDVGPRILWNLAAQLSDHGNKLIHQVGLAKQVPLQLSFLRRPALGMQPPGQTHCDEEGEPNQIAD